jgi:hypothetical protein
MKTFSARKIMASPRTVHGNGNGSAIDNRSTGRPIMIFRPAGRQKPSGNYKTQASGDLPQVNYGNGNFTGSAVRVSIAGTVIPEPGTYALLGGLAALGFVALRRRNRR